MKVKVSLLVLAAVLMFSGLSFLRQETFLSGYQEALKEKNYEEALEGIRQLESSKYFQVLKLVKMPLIFPDQYARALFIKGVSLYVTGEKQEAKEIFQRIREVSKDKSFLDRASYNSAKIREEEGSFIDAMWRYAEVLKKAPDYYKAKVNLEHLRFTEEKFLFQDSGGEKKGSGGLEDLKVSPWSREKSKEKELEQVPKW